MARTHERPTGRIDYVRNRSSRSSAKIRAVIVHTTESHDRPGRGDVDSVHAWFDNPKSKASSHVIIDAEAHSTTCVPDSEKAWTCAAYNRATLNIELIAFADTPRWRWLKRTRQLKKAAKFTAYWCREHKISVRRAAFADGQVTRDGIGGHSELGQAGGGHHDPGDGFPWDRFMRYVSYYVDNGWKQ